MTCLAIIGLLINIASQTGSVRHGDNLFWVQNADNTSSSSRIVSIFGDPEIWIINRTATTSFITAPNTRWRFTGLTFNFKKRTLYWSDTGNKKIQGFVLNNEDTPFTIFDGISSGVRGLAVDWLTNNIYWADSLYNWIVMSPAVEGSSLFRIVINTDLEHPLALVVHPFRGLLFWSDKGAVAKIEKSDTTGNNRRTIVERDLVTPMGLVLDMEGSRLYWVDRDRGTIESVDIFTSERTVHFTVEDTMFVSLALYHDYLFVTDQRDRLLYVFNKKSGKHEVNFSTGEYRPGSVVMYHSGAQKYDTGVTSSPCDLISCQHMCVSSYGGVPKCVCANGYQLEVDGKSCVDDGRYPTPMFIYSIGNALCRFPGNLPDMNLDDVTLDTQCFLTKRRAVLALGANIRENTLYFAENATKTISKVKLSRGESPEIIIGGTGIVEGLSIDWIASNIYWSDSWTRKIMVAKSDGRYQSVLHGDRLDKPTGVVVDAVNRMLFWSDRGMRPRIERSSLDGTGREIFVLDNLGSPIHLSIDYLTKRLFWTDSLSKTIESIRLDGKQRQTVMSQTEATYFGITLFQDFVIWTETGDHNGIHAGLKHTGQKVRGIVHPGIGTANDVITFDVSTQPLATGPCDIFNGCQQLCLPGNDDNHRKCACAMGFQKGLDGTSCLTEPWHDHFLLFADTFQKQIYQMSTLTGHFKAIALSGHDNPISVDFDPESGHIYWSDVAAKVLKRALLNGSEEEIVKLMSANAIPDGIAVDTVSRLLYYTDAGNKIIAAMTLAEKYHVTLIRRRLNKPRAIALDPIRGYMYWTDWSKQSRIEKAAMDGSNRKIIIDTGMGGWPNGITIDITGEKLYWCNARTQTIETANLNGDNRRVIYRTNKAHFFGITLSGDTLYYTDWTKKTIMKLEQVRSEYISTTIGQSVFARANDIHAYKSESDSRVINQNACSVRNGGCSHVCLPKPNGRKCACPDNVTRGIKSCRTVARKPDVTSRPLYPVSTPIAPPFIKIPIQYYTTSLADDLHLQESTSASSVLPPAGSELDNSLYDLSTESELENNDESTEDAQTVTEILDSLSNKETPTENWVTSQTPPISHYVTADEVDESRPIREQINKSKGLDSSAPSGENGKGNDVVPSIRTSGNGNKPRLPVFTDNERRSEIIEGVGGNNSTVSIFGDRITYIGLTGILVGGLTIMIVIITVAIVIYKRSEPRKPKCQQTGDDPDAIISRIGKYSATYDMPLQDTVTSSHTSAEHLTELSDNYFSGHVTHGLENPSFARGESNNTIYEEIPGYSPTGTGTPTFITFAKVSSPERQTAESSSPIEAPPSSLHGSGGATVVTHGATIAHARRVGSSSASRDSEESSFTNQSRDRDSSGSSPANEAPPVPDKGKLTGSDVTYAAVSRRNPDSAVCRIAAVIEKQYTQRR